MHNIINFEGEDEMSRRQSLLEIWRRSLTMDDTSDPLDIAIAELSDYFKMPQDEVKRRCINWEQDSLKEWESKDRSSKEALLDFYQTQISWIFDTMWYHARQYHGQENAESVEIALELEHLKPGHHLDYGAGPGSSSLFFHSLGWKISLADISTTMLGFAKWRLKRHQVPASFYDTASQQLPDEDFDLITAFDVMVHVPDITETLRQLHKALKPGGYFVFNIDNRPKTRLTEWHLYEEQYPILREVRKIGFKKHPKITYFHVYQKIERGSIGTKFIGLYDRLRYNRYVNFIGNRVRKIRRKLGQTIQ